MSLAKRLGAIFGTGTTVDPALIPRLSGSVVQVVGTQTGAVSTTTNIMPFDDTIPQNTEGADFFTRTITPTSAASKLRIEVVFNASMNGASYATVALFQGVIASALACGTKYGGNGTYEQVSFSHVMTAGTTSEITFSVRAGMHMAGTLTMNGDGGARRLGGILFSSITVTEIAA